MNIKPPYPDLEYGILGIDKKGSCPRCSKRVLMANACMHVCIVTITSRGRECGVSCREEQFMIFAAAPQKAPPAALKVGIGFLGDIPAPALSLGRRRQVF
jgi:hypothetical protein